MDRSTALLLSLVFFIIFVMIAYYGAKVTFFSSITLGIFLSLIILGFFYPISQLAEDDPDFTLVLYAIFIIIGIFILGLYILYHALCDIRIDCQDTCKDICQDTCQDICPDTCPDTCLINEMKL